MARVMSGARPPIAAAHLRKDAWWALPVTVVIVLGSFIVYSTWAAFQNAHYFVDPVPVAVLLAVPVGKRVCTSTFGYGLPDVSLPIIGIVSPAFLILGGPGLFRLTCYYYRKAYYRSFWLAPAACAVRDVKSGYTGETRFPLIVQNFHRYAWYVAVIFIVLLTWDAAPGLPLSGSRRRPSLRHRRGHAGDVGQRDPARRLHVLLPLVPPRVRRPRRHVLAGARRAIAPGTSSRGSTSVTRCSRGSRCSAWGSRTSTSAWSSMGVIRDLRII